MLSTPTPRIARLAFVLALAACGGTTPDDEGAGGAGPVACTPVTQLPGCPDPVPGWADVQPVFAANCQACHGTVAGGPWPLDTYRHVADWQHEVRAFVADCSMPPPDSGVVLADEDRALILEWLACGAPE